MAKFYKLLEQAERDLDQCKAERDAYKLKAHVCKTILDLIGERLPQCQAIGDYPGGVDELRQWLGEVLGLAQQYIEGVITVITTTEHIETDRQAYNRTKHERLMRIAEIRKAAKL